MLIASRSSLLKSLMIVVAATIVLPVGPVNAVPISPPSDDAGDFSLSYADAAWSSRAAPHVQTMLDEDTGVSESEGGYLTGPYFLRSADPEPVGELEFKFIYGYETSSGEDDEHEFEFELEWGLTENNHFILSADAELGEGRVEGNGDLTIGLHTRLWKEDDWMPAFAMRNLLRVPTGYHSSGVDYTARGLFTKTIVPDSLRAHVNPFITFIGGDNEEDERDVQWGVAIGVDCRLADDMVLVASYVHESGEAEGTRNDHALEFGLDWHLAEHQTLAFSSELGLDGDDSGPNWGARISYIFSLDVR